MKNSFRAITVLTALSVLFSSILLPAISNADTSGPCSVWGLFWNNGAQVQSSDFTNGVLPPSPMTVNAGDYGSTTSTPPTGITLSPITNASSTYVGQTPQWGCSESAATGAALAQQGNPPGTESCVAAAEIAQKYAFYTNLGETSQIGKNIGHMIIPKIMNSFSAALSNYNIDLSKLVDPHLLNEILGTQTLSINQLSSFFNNSSTFNSVLSSLAGGNSPLASGVKQQTQQLLDQAKRELAKLAPQVVGEIEKTTQQILQTSVPVSDQTVQNNQEKQMELQRGAIAEQRRAQIIADTKGKCDLLLKQTVETIKRSLLYQLTTETVDWIQGGNLTLSNGKIIVKPPQFVKQPLKSLAEAGLTAVDRLISNIAPQLCSPFRFAVTLQIPSVSHEANPYYQQVSCTLNQVVSNIQGFYNDFRIGGWAGYQEILMPQNNYYGASANVQAIANQVAAAAVTAQQDAQKNGYNNEYQCTEWGEYKIAKDANGNPITNMDNCTQDVAQTTNQVIWVGSENACYENACVSNDPSCSNGVVDSQSGTNIPADVSSVMPDTSHAKKDVLGNIFPSETDRNFFYTCLNTQIVQPSSVAAGLAQQATQSDVNAIINAQDLTDIGTILQNAIINKLTKVGVNGLQGLLQKLPAWTSNFQIKTQ